MSYPTFKANIIIRGKIECVTGMHIGGSKEKLEIGGLDSPVMRNPYDQFPYIPGSSLKGKMRHLLEYVTGALGDPVEVEVDQNGEKQPKYGSVSKAPKIVRIFGIGAEHKEAANDAKEDKPLKNIGLTRLTVRDAHPDEFTKALWKDMDTELTYTEYKPENTIDRLTSAANPRFIERVVAGSRFNFEMVYTVYEWSGSEGKTVGNTEEDLQNIVMGLRLLESSALGKSGSRGYGKIKFYLEPAHILEKADYKGTDGLDKYKAISNELTDNLEDLQTLSGFRLEYGG